MRRKLSSQALFYGLLLLWFGSCASLSGENAPLVLLYQQGTPLGEVTGVNGTYGPSCKNRAGDWSWTGTSTCGDLPNPVLSVEEGDENCTLIVKSVVIGCQLYQTYGLPLDGDVQPDGFPFYKQGSCIPDFYGNGYIQISNGRVVVRFVYASNLNNASGSAVARYQTITALVLDARVPAPDYLPDLSQVDIRVDANHVVTDVNGNAILTPGIQPGEWYTVVPRIPAPQRTYSHVHSLFQSKPHIAVGTPIPVSTFQLLGQTLSQASPVQWDIIVSHEENGIFSYELIGLRFLPPTP